MSTVLIVHGVEGHPQENWFPWLKNRLEEAGHSVIIPQFPTPEHQTLQSWQAIYSFQKAKLGESPVLIGHSLGGAFVLRNLEKQQAKAAFLVAPVSCAGQGKEFESSMTTFIEGGHDYEKIKKNCSNIVVFQSDDDPYIPQKDSEELAKKIDAEFVLIPKAGHFGAWEGYKEFPQLLEKIQSL